VRGASTISQQVARICSCGRWRLFRKGLEPASPCHRVVLAQGAHSRGLLEYRRFGRGIYGVQAAAERYFHENARRLNRADSALLAAVLPNPRRLRVEAPSAYVWAAANGSRSRCRVWVHHLLNLSKKISPVSPDPL